MSCTAIPQICNYTALVCVTNDKHCAQPRNPCDKHSTKLVRKPIKVTFYVTVDSPLIAPLRTPHTMYKRCHHNQPAHHPILPRHRHRYSYAYVRLSSSSQATSIRINFWTFELMLMLIIMMTSMPKAILSENHWLLACVVQLYAHIQVHKSVCT